MDDASKKKLGLAAVLLIVAIAIGAFAMKGGGPTSTGEGMIDYKKKPPSDMDPIPADQGGKGGPPSGSTEGRGI
ncbi:MAG: hypothetical protein IT206_04865 [Fimbriimonadaceae bacterium]|nr:hypothetical protein [Fimbriimonadaceae bacterium]